MKLKLTLTVMVLGLVLPGLLSAAEIITKEDFIQRVVIEENFVKLADHFIVMFDASNSMKRQYKKGSPESRYEIARSIIKNKVAELPELGYNAGLYLYTPYTELEPMAPLDRAGWGQAVDAMPADPSGPTFLAQGLKKIEPVLQGLSGKTVVFIFSDGQYSQIEGIKEPENYTREFANKYNACFYVIGAPQDNLSQKRLNDMAKANACSRMIPFSNFVENPEYTTGALYTVRATERIETITESKVVGLKVREVLFDFDKANLHMEFVDEIDALGSFMLKNPKSYVLLEGYTDSTGPKEYNLGLSLRRAEAIANYLSDNFSIGSDRVVINYYGPDNPAASNATSEGRRKNRRVEVAVGGL